MRNTLKDSNIAGKIDDADKEKLEKMVNDTIEWMDHNQVGAAARAVGRRWVLGAAPLNGVRCGGF